MNKAFRILLFIGLAIIFCVSCSKVESLIPENYERENDSIPFSVEAVPAEGCDSITLYLVSNGDTIPKRLFRMEPDKTLDLGSLENNNTNDTTLFIGGHEVTCGDSLILTAWKKNGYTFINWVRDGKIVTDSDGNDISANSVYGFKLTRDDFKVNDKSYTIINHHFEARFGLDYMIQMIPPIDSIIPLELIAAMGSNLHFGDTPPKIEVCFNVLKDHLFLDTIYGRDLTDGYGSDFVFPKPIFYNEHNVFEFGGQHRCVAESHYYERGNYADQLYYYATVEDSIFIMGHDTCFTAYFHQTWKTWGVHGIGIDYLLDVTRRESVVLSGKVTDDGIADFHWGMLAESYTPADYPYIGIAGWGGQPDINDILVFHSDTICPYYPTFQKYHFD